MSTGSDDHELAIDGEELLTYLSLLSQSQGSQKINFSKAFEKIYSDHFENQMVGQTAFKDEWALSEELHSFQQAMEAEQKMCAKLKEIEKILEKAHKKLTAPAS